MIPFLFLSQKPKCYAETKLADPIEGMRLRFVEYITNYGERTPLASLYNLSSTDNWTCDSEDATSGYIDAAPEVHYRLYQTVLDPRFNEFKKNCRPGDLTINGMNQQQALGQEVRKHYVDNLKFLPESMDPSQFIFLSGPEDRCLKSAQSFLLGLYETKSDNEVLNIETGTEEVTSLYPNTKSCPELNQQQQDFYNSNATNNYLQQTMEKLKDLRNLLNLSVSHENLISMCDWAVSYSCSEYVSTPSIVTDDVYQTCSDALDYYMYKWFGLNNEIPFSTTLRHMLKIADEIIGQLKPVKFVLISTQESAIAAMYSFFNIVKDQLPLYRSNVALEFWQDESGDIYIRFVVDGEPLYIPQFNGNLIRFDKFRYWADPKIQHCLNVQF